jgi:hypothetical protein
MYHVALQCVDRVCAIATCRHGVLSCRMHHAAMYVPVCDLTVPLSLSQELWEKSAAQDNAAACMNLGSVCQVLLHPRPVGCLWGMGG